MIVSLQGGQIKVETLIFPVSDPYCRTERNRIQHSSSINLKMDIVLCRIVSLIVKESILVSIQLENGGIQPAVHRSSLITIKPYIGVTLSKIRPKTRLVGFYKRPTVVAAVVEIVRIGYRIIALYASAIQFNFFFICIFWCNVHPHRIISGTVECKANKNSATGARKIHRAGIIRAIQRELAKGGS